MIYRPLKAYGPCGMCRHAYIRHTDTPMGMGKCNACPCKQYQTKGEVWQRLKDAFKDQQTDRTRTAAEEGWGIYDPFQTPPDLNKPEDE